MNQIELVTSLPNWKWKEHSQKEIILTGEELVETSDFVWQIGNCAVAGFVYTSYLSPPWMWFVLAENVTIGDLVDFRRLVMQAVPQGTHTAVAEDFKLAIRFAKIYGFEPTGEKIIYADRPYIIMRKI